jgi:hypothetical protein
MNDCEIPDATGPGGPSNRQRAALDLKKRIDVLQDKSDKLQFQLDDLESEMLRDGEPLPDYPKRLGGPLDKDPF